VTASLIVFQWMELVAPWHAQIVDISRGIHHVEFSLNDGPDAAIEYKRRFRRLAVEQVLGCGVGESYR